MSLSVHRLGLPICVAVASLLVLLVPQTLPAQSQGGAPFWISCDTPADESADICKGAGKRIAEAQNWKLAEKSSLSGLEDSALVASAQQDGAHALVIRLKQHRSPGTEKRYAVEIIGASRALKRTYGMSKISKLEDELVRLGDIVLSTPSAPPAQAEDTAGDEPNEEPAKVAEADPAEEVVDEPVAQPADQVVDEPVAQPAETVVDEPVDQPAEAVMDEPVEQPPPSPEPELVQEDAAPEPPAQEMPAQDTGSEATNQGKEDAVENERKNVGGIAGACSGGSGGRQGSRQRQTAIPVVLTLLALGQFVRRRADSSRRN